MSLKPCRECKNEVSTEAPTCPKCGTKNPAKKPTSKIVIAGATLFALFGVSVCVTNLNRFAARGRASTGTVAAVQAMETNPPAPVCPQGYALAGSRGCFTADSINKQYGNMYAVRGKLISKETCGNLIVVLSALDASGNVICDGNGVITDVAEGQVEIWSGNMINCNQKPATVTLKMSTCM